MCVQRSRKRNIGKRGCSEITKGLECQMKGFFTSVDQVESLTALNRKMSFGKSNLAVTDESWSGRSWEEKVCSLDQESSSQSLN